MSRIDWLQCMADAIDEKGAASGRHIIRFKSREAFRSVLRTIRSQPARSPLRKAVRPLPLICALAVPLHSAEKLQAFTRLWSIERDTKVAAVHAVAPAFTAAEPVIPWGVVRVRAPQAWHRSSGSRVRIGIIDTGIDYHHPDLQGCIAGGVNLIYRHLLPLDDNGHGTHIAGTIAGAAERDGIIGVAPGASIYAVKAFDHNGTAFVSDIVAGIEWCVRNRIQIINMSFGMKTHSSSLEAAVELAHRAGTVIVASSGNDGRTGVDFPARFPSVISVGASGRSRSVAPFSNKSRLIDIYAPGERIYSTWLRGRHFEMSGTSMATSHVTGSIALLLALRPELRPEAIKAALQRSATKLRPTRGGSPPAAGEVNAARLLRSLRPARGRD